MDLILTAYADAHLSDMDEAGLQLYDRLLNENDPDLYTWVTGQVDPPAPFLDLMTDISQTLQNKT